MIRIREISVGFKVDVEDLRSFVLDRLGVGDEALIGFSVVRRAIDARRGRHILAIYTVDAEVTDEAAVLERFKEDPRAGVAPNMSYQMPEVGKPVVSSKRPVVVGCGPCGLFIGLILAQKGLRPLLIERGKDVLERVKDINAFWQEGTLLDESNVQFGEGGAGTFSDGKLNTQIKDKLNRSRKVLEEFVKAGGPTEILYQAKPHLGTDNLVRIVKNIREEIIALGGEVRFETKLTGVEIADGRVIGIVVNGDEQIEADGVALALGHSARDTFEMLHEAGVTMESKPFSIGVRIEHPQSIIDKSQYGKYAGHKKLGAAEYKLVHHCDNGRSVYTFCMCPGGKVIGAASEAGGVVTNGMSYYSRSGKNANSALLIGVGPDDFGGDGPLAGIAFQRKWEQKAFEVGGRNYFAPVQRVGDFMEGRATKQLGKVVPSYKPGVTPCDLGECLPGFVVRALAEGLVQLDKKIKDFAMYNAVMTAVESRSSSPVRILRDEGFESLSVRGLFPSGEGAGYAGGIISSAVDGVKVAEAICQWHEVHR